MVLLNNTGVSKWMNLGCSFSKMDYYSVRSSGVLEGSGAKFLMNFNEATGEFSIVVIYFSKVKIFLFYFYGFSIK